MALNPLKLNPVYNLLNLISPKRTANMEATIKSAISGGGVQSNTGVSQVDTALSAVASHPFITAGAGASVTTAVGRSALSSGAGIIKDVAVKNPLLAVGGVTAGTIALKSEKGRETIVNAPSSFNNFTSNVAGAIDNPTKETIGKIAKENPLLTGSAFALGLIGAGGGIRGLASLFATIQNTNAIKENTKTTQPEIKMVDTPVKNEPPASSSPVGTPILAPPVSTSSVTPRRNVGGARRRKRKAKEPQRIVNNVKVYNIDDRDNVDRKVYKQRSQYA